MKTAPAWVEPVMRAGYGARGTVYLLVGGLALLAAWSGGAAEDQTGALETLRGNPMGRPVLALIALGLACYAIWRVICGAMDLEAKGTGAKGAVGRIGQVVSGLVNAGLALSVARLAMGGQEQGGQGSQTLTSHLLQMPAGQWLVGLLGLVVVGAGGMYVLKGWREEYREHLRFTPTMAKLAPAARAGVIAHGVVIAMIGSFFLFAALHADPSEAGGLSKAFDTVRGAAFGRMLLGALAVGMVGFGLYCWVEARARILPTRPHEGVVSMAQRMGARLTA
ncbi:DUF1206 domain-containing protein [Frigidibacter sp. MR17.14]|uniref:DUF1206 domain-containing protein n=1 Tax=Frigidibacter sp. MR17.14 TaxID=3126509 RepID=UPI003012CEA6